MPWCRWTIEALARKFHVRRQRILAILALKVRTAYISCNLYHVSCHLRHHLHTFTHSITVSPYCTKQVYLQLATLSLALSRSLSIGVLACAGVMATGTGM